MFKNQNTMRIKNIIYWPFCAILFVACNDNGYKSDAYGNFEVDEITVSAEASGRVIWLSVEEGTTTDSGQVVGLIDTTQIALKRNQLKAQIKAAASRLPNITAQVEVQLEQIKVLEVDRNRLANMLSDGAATQKQLDDLDGKISITKKQIKAIETQQVSIHAEIDVLKTQLVQVDDQIERCKVINPSKGSILVRFIQQGEVVPMGKPIYKLANMDYLFLKVFVAGDQLHRYKIGDEVLVNIDGDDGKIIEYKGNVSWISSSAEFTPKIIQTRDERVKMVYAVKIRVQNDGILKIGMPGEVVLKDKG
jgi:HlyD family secretion protein